MTLKTLNLVAGICLLFVTIAELFEEGANLELEIEHGLLIYALAHVLSKGVEFYEGFLKIKETREQEASA